MISKYWSSSYCGVVVNLGMTKLLLCAILTITDMKVRSQRTAGVVLFRMVNNLLTGPPFRKREWVTKTM